MEAKMEAAAQDLPRYFIEARIWIDTVTGAPDWDEIAKVVQVHLEQQTFTAPRRHSDSHDAGSAGFTGRVDEVEVAGRRIDR